MRRHKWYRIYGGIVLVALVVGLAAVGASGCGDSAKASVGPVKLTEVDNGKSLEVKVGEIIEITLPGNPTTGYCWSSALRDKDKALLEEMGEPAYTASSTEGNLVGGGGTYTFTFKAEASGSAVIKLVYERPWETVEPLETYQLSVNVTK